MSRPRPRRDPDPTRLAVRAFYGLSCLPLAGFVALRIYANSLEGWGVWALAGAVRGLVFLSAGIGVVGVGLIAWLRRVGRPVTGVVLATLAGGSLAVAFLLRSL